jgi:hypothetical protein
VRSVVASATCAHLLVPRPWIARFLPGARAINLPPMRHLHTAKRSG